MYHLLHVCHTLVYRIYVHPEILCVFWYIDVLHVRNCHLLV